MKTNEGKHNGEEQNRQQAGQVKAGAGQGCGLLQEANATRGNRATPGAQLPEAEQKEHQGGHNAGKTTGNTTVDNSCKGMPPPGQQAPTDSRNGENTTSK